MNETPKMHRICAGRCDNGNFEHQRGDCTVSKADSHPCARPRGHICICGTGENGSNTALGCSERQTLIRFVCNVSLHSHDDKEVETELATIHGVECTGLFITAQLIPLLGLSLIRRTDANPSKSFDRCSISQPMIPDFEYSMKPPEYPTFPDA